jgi:broad specificity phosphatase PhoE
MTKLFLIRHGETDWNVQRRYQGHADTELNANGIMQANKLQPVLGGLSFDTVYSSDLKRVMQTATHAGVDAANIVKEPRMREVSFGKFEGLTHDEIEATYPEEFLAWGANRENNVHGGEDVRDVFARVRQFYVHLRDDYALDDHVLCFAHGGTTAIFLAIALGAAPSMWWQFHVNNTAVTVINLYEMGSQLVRFNDTHHLG